MSEQESHFTFIPEGAPREEVEQDQDLRLKQILEQIRNAPEGSVVSFFSPQGEKYPAELLSQINEQLSDENISTITTEGKPSINFWAKIGEQATEGKTVVLASLGTKELGKEETQEKRRPIDALAEQWHWMQRTTRFLSKQFPGRPLVILGMSEPEKFREWAESQDLLMKEDISRPAKEQGYLSVSLSPEQTVSVYLPEGRVAQAKADLSLKEKFKSLERIGFENIQKYISIPTVSSKEGLAPESITELANHIKQQLEEMGAQCTIEEGERGYPILVAEIRGNSDRWVTVYGMGDVRPVLEQTRDQWVADPFSGAIVEYEGEEVMIGRGAENTKGALAATIETVGDLKKEGKLPCSIQFIVDFEEEIGSPSIERILEKYASQVQRSEFILYPAIDAYPVFGGFKGTTDIKITLKGGESVHSGYSSITEPRAVDLLGIVQKYLSELVARNRHELELEPLQGRMTEGDHTAIEEFCRQTDFNQYLELLRRRGVKPEELKYSDYQQLVEAECCHSSLGVSEIRMGGPGVLPQTVEIGLSARLAPGSTTDIVEIERLFRDYFEQGIEGLSHEGELQTQVELSNIKPGIKAVDRGDIQWLLDKYQLFGVNQQFVPSAFGAVGIAIKMKAMFPDKPFVLFDIGKGGKQHAENEYITTESVPLFRKFLYEVLKNFGG